MRDKGLGLFSDDYKIMFVGTTENADIPGIPKTEKCKLCEPIEAGHLELQTLNVAVFSGKELDGFQKTKGGSNSVIQLSSLVDCTIRQIVANICSNIRQKRNVDYDNAIKILENYTIRFTNANIDRVIHSLFKAAGKKVVQDKTPADVTSINNSLQWHLQHLSDDEIPEGVKLLRHSNAGVIQSTPKPARDASSKTPILLDLTAEEQMYIQERRSSSSYSDHTSSSALIHENNFTDMPMSYMIAMMTNVMTEVVVTTNNKNELAIFNTANTSSSSSNSSSSSSSSTVVRTS